MDDFLSGDVIRALWTRKSAVVAGKFTDRRPQLSAVAETREANNCASLYHEHDSAAVKMVKGKEGREAHCKSCLATISRLQQERASSRTHPHASYWDGQLKREGL